jgi:hypothetical protein
MKPVAILSLNVAQLERLRNEIHGLFDGLNEANTGALMGAGYWSLRWMFARQMTASSGLNYPG